MALRDLTAKSVKMAMKEFDRLGRKAFLGKYGYGEAISYFLQADGTYYDSKAIAGVAHGYLDGKTALKPSEFTGGDKTVAATLHNLGFKISGPDRDRRNPPWSRDELVLALELYMQNPNSPPGKNSKPIVDLSNMLNKLETIYGRKVNENYRNPNGVYMKVMNFRRFDLDFQSAGKVGLIHGGKGDEEVWSEFAGDRGYLTAVANAIRSQLQQNIRPVGPTEVDEDEEAAEGRLLTVAHCRRERSRYIIEKRKQKALREEGELRCEACGLNFAEKYGARGNNFIEVHHTKPLHTLREGEKTKLKDLALVCANCHRMIHRSKNWLSIDQLIGIISPIIPISSIKDKI